MEQQDRALLIEAININSVAIVEALEVNTEKVQELLERVECIDNTLDDIKDEDCQAETLKGQNEIIRRLEQLIQQGRP
jgi:hypothetical protein